MGIGRKFTKTVLTRPVKGGSRKRQRQRQHRERLVGLGMDRREVEKLDPKAVRDLLKHPAKVAAKANAAAGAGASAKKKDEGSAGA